MELPVLVVHGAVVWKLLLLALVAGSLAAIVFLRTLGARRRARTRVAALLEQITPLAEGKVCVRGRLRGGSVATLEGNGELNDHADPALTIECADGSRAELAVVPRVLAGSRARRSWFRRPSATPAPLANHAGRLILHTISDGDEVVVTARARRIAVGDTDYREASSGWRLEGVTEIAAVTPAAKPAPRHPIAVAFAILAAAGIWFGVLYKVGRVALHRIEDRPARADRDEIASFGSFAIAAAMPGSRDRALSTQSSRFFEWYGHRGASIAARERLDELIGPCEAHYHRLEEARFEEALVATRACGDRKQEAYVQLLLGNYAEAAALQPASLKEREIALIGAGDWRAAADAADAQADRTPGEGADAVYAVRANAHARCRASWYRHLAGDPSRGALASLDTPMCRVYQALLEPPARQRELLQALRDDQLLAGMRDAESAAMVGSDAILQLVGATPVAYGPGRDLGFGVGPTDWLMAFHAGIEAADVRASMHVSRAGIAGIRGDFAAARAEAERVPNPDDRVTTALWIALHEGAPLPAHPTVHPGLASRVALRDGSFGRDRDLMGVYPEACAGELNAAVQAALAGDGGPLATVLVQCEVYYIIMPELMLGILPHVKQHRAELAEALRGFRDRHSSMLMLAPFRLLEGLALVRDTARMVGDHEEVDRAQAIITRHAKMLEDRDRTIALVLLGF